MVSNEMIFRNGEEAIVRRATYQEAIEDGLNVVSSPAVEGDWLTSVIEIKWKNEEYKKLKKDVIHKIEEKVLKINLNCILI